MGVLESYLEDFKQKLFHREQGLIIFDNFYPNLISGFRIAEYNHYLKVFKNCKIYSTNPDFENLMVDYGKYYPEYTNLILPFDAKKKYSGSLGYTVFLNNAFNFLPIFEKCKIPFVFTLYPGGGLWLNQEKSDNKLRAVCSSSLLKKIIVTQKITKEYLLEKGFCSEDLIEFIYGGIIPTNFYVQNKKPKLYYKTTKDSFDICFVAQKYMEKGIDKGYDIFIDVCKELSKISKNFTFHVVGQFNATDIDVSEIHNRIRFYGLQFTDFFPEFYSRMDIILSPNVPFVLYPGNFDGFPTFAFVEAGICGVAVFPTDELGLNLYFTNNVDVCIIPRNPSEICNIIMKYINNLEDLYQLSKNIQKKFLELFDSTVQIDARLNILRKYL